MLELPIYDIFRVPKFYPLINVIVQALASKAGVKRPGEEAPQGQPGQSTVFSGLIYASCFVPFPVLRHFDLVAFPVSKLFQRSASFWLRSGFRNIERPGGARSANIEIS